MSVIQWRFSGYLFWMCLWFGCAASLVPQASASEVTHALPRFTSINVQGSIDVTLHASSRRAPRAVLRGDARDLQRVKLFVQRDTLFISSVHPNGYFKKNRDPHSVIRVDVDVKTLHQLVYRGSGQLNATGLRTRGLALHLINTGKTVLSGDIGLNRVTIEGPGETAINGVTGENLNVVLINNPTVQLRGVVSLASLQVNGDASIDLYWLNARRMVVAARDGARIQSAGIAEVLEVELWGNSVFNGRYLRAKDAYIKTHDEALVQLSTTEHQHVLARDRSHVYFYALPSTRNDFMANSGASFDMRDLGWRELEEYSAYNK